MDMSDVRGWGLLGLLAAGCSEYDIKGSDAPNAPTSTTESTSTTNWTSTGSADPGDACDGLDNDGDGLIDEGHPDVDGDGTADCVDDSCEVVVEGADTVPLRKDCLSFDPELVDDPWEVSLEWTFAGSGSVLSSPVTGQLTDDNGDGVIDEADTPDVALLSYETGDLYIVSGDGSGEICHQAGWHRDGGVLIADVDGDGRNEVVGPTSLGQVRAIDGACDTEWVSSESYSFYYPVATASDLDGDGVVEVIVDVAVVDGRNGDPVATLATSGVNCYRAPFTGDLDRDGEIEIVLGDTVFDGDGNVVWSVAGAAAYNSCFGGLVDIDGDPEAEVVLTLGPTLGVYEHDGTLAWRADVAEVRPGPPCAGDLDGDGEVEIVVPSGTLLRAYEADGASKWATPMSDGSGAAGCSVFDMNGDAIYEVLFADEVALRLYDGATGAVLWENDSHSSGTLWETPTVADIDNDGSAEMLVANSPYGGDATTGLTVFGHDGSGWPASGPTWGLHDFSATNQNPDGSIPATPTAPVAAAQPLPRPGPTKTCRERPTCSPGRSMSACPPCDPAAGVVSLS